MDKEILKQLGEMNKELKDLRAEIKEIRTQQKITHEKQEKTHKNQVDMENKLDRIIELSRLELDELQEMEEDRERNLISESTDSYHQKLLENLTRKMTNDTWLNNQHEKIIQYLFGDKKYIPSRKKFEGANQEELRKSCHINKNAMKDLLLKLEEEHYIISEITSEVDSTRKAYFANKNNFKH